MLQHNNVILNRARAVIFDARLLQQEGEHWPALPSSGHTRTYRLARFSGFRFSVMEKQ